LTKANVSALFQYDSSEIEKVLPKFNTEMINKIKDRALGKPGRGQVLKDHVTEEFKKERLWIKEKANLNLRAEHISPLILEEVKTVMVDHIIFCPDERLQAYKGEPIPEYVKKKNLTTSAQSRLVQFIRDVVDSKVIDSRHSLDLVRDVENQPFTTSITEQGSGVKSLICLVADILSDRQAKILLIDEPELGLNPSCKHAFLKFLIEQTNSTQIFLATHDPTFVNPLLWKRESVSIYLFSIVKDEFVKVNLVQSKQDPSTFAGFLPHTTSLKQIHFYVEGTTDVYIFQMFLDKYVKKKFKKDWYRILSKIGIFHLGGDYWSHLLYTVPKSPYSSIVILDGDKVNTLGAIIEKYPKIDEGRFKFCTLSDLPNLDMMKSCPIYMLTSPQIEDYLEPRPTSKDEGPLVAQKMDYIPPEIEKVFDAVFEKADIH